MIRFFKCRNFNSYEVAHRPEQTSPELELTVAFMMGVLQSIRDGLYFKYGKEVGIIVCSGNRILEVNAATAGSAKDSNHIWKLLKKYFILGGKKILGLQLYSGACDIKPVGITLQQLYDYCRTHIRGEVYLNRAQGIVHVAPANQGDKVEPSWIQ